MSLLQQEPQDTISEESQENGESDLQSTWQEIARNYIVVLQSVIEEIIKPVKNGDKHPDHLVELANTVSMISSGFDTLELTHEEKFEQLRANTAGLVVVLWHLYNKSRKLWPPPKFRAPIKEFIETVCGIHELMERKSEENLAKRLLVGSFGIRDLGKFKKYRRKLGSMASFLEGKPNNVNIGELLLEVVNGRAQPQDSSNTELPDEAADSPTNNGTKKRTDTQENKAEGSRQRQATVDKPTKETAKHEQVVDDEGKGKESKASGKKKAKDTTKDDSAAVKAGEDDKSAKKKPKRASTVAKNLVTPPKLEDQESDDKGKGISQRFDDDEVNTAEASAPSDPVATSVPREKKPAKPKVKSKTIPLPQTSNSISGISFNNTGSGNMNTNTGPGSMYTNTGSGTMYTNSGPGTMYNSNVGNIVNSSISNIGNDYSMNYGLARRKGTHG